MTTTESSGRWVWRSACGELIITEAIINIISVSQRTIFTTVMMLMMMIIVLRCDTIVSKLV